MPGVISASDFIRETREDLSSPTTSNFVTRIPQCKETVSKLEEVGQSVILSLNPFFYAQGVIWESCVVHASLESYTVRNY